MAGQPSAAELVAAVREFLLTLAGHVTLTGRDAFHAKVAANALAIVARELASDCDAVEVAALDPFTRHPGESRDATRPAALGPGFRRDDGGEQDGSGVLALRGTLCAVIRAGALDTATPGLIDALIVATCARLAVDNPRYSTLARLAANGDAVDSVADAAAQR